MVRKDIVGDGFSEPVAEATQSRRFVFLSADSRAVALAMVVSDILALLLAFIIGTVLSDVLRDVLTSDATDYGLFGPRTNVFPALMGLMVAVFAFGGLYRRDGWEAEEIRHLVTGIAVVALFDAVLAFMTKDHFSRLWFVTAWPLVMILVVTCRMGARSLSWAKSALTSHIVLIGSGKPSAEFLYELRESRSGPINFVATLPLGAVPTLSLNDMHAWLVDQAKDEGIDASQIQVVIAPAPEEAHAARLLTEKLAAMQQPFLVSVSYDGLARTGLVMHKIVGADMVLAGVNPPRQEWFGRVIKRTMDLVLTGVGMILIAPVMMVIAVLIKLEDGGPVFFSQPRVGKGRARFNCLKFRSMRVDAKERLEELLANDPAARAEWEGRQKLKNDPRITRIGNFLRETSLDELPQLLNILRGDMSLVGPRPIVGPEISTAGSDYTYYESPEFRHYVRCVPGLTGLWQVAGRHRTSLKERIRLDRWYARNQSTWLDLMIVLKTFRAVIGRQGG
ncbi:MAG: exopolysaccharide biosynthesis polyprenyl glycosylphosphotransferase [Pseudomonadota bacterium]